MKTSFFIIISLLIFIVSCKHEPDPCIAIRNEPGGFKIEEVGTTNRGIEAKDTVVENCLIWFTSHRTYDNYTWWVGTEAEPRKGKKISVVFPENTNINVMLIGKRAPTPCIPGDDGIDTFIQELITVPWEKSPVIGHWQGYLTTNPADTFTVKIIDQPDMPNCGWDGAMMLNLPKNSTPKDPTKANYCMPNVWVRYNGLDFDYHGFDGEPVKWGRQNGFGYFKNRYKELHIEFEGKSDFQDWHHLHFIGKRVK